MAREEKTYIWARGAIDHEPSPAMLAIPVLASLLAVALVSPVAIILAASPFYFLVAST